MNCVQCGGRLSGRATMYCGNACKLRAWKIARPELHAAQSARERDAAKLKDEAERQNRAPIACRQCGGMFISLRRAALCSDECRRALAAAKDRIRQVKRHGVVERKCHECRKSFAPAYGCKRRAFCCQRCADRWSNRRTSQGSNYQRAKAAGVERRYFNERRIFIRDGWTCQLCGVKTPERLRGKHLPTSPELDHIVPLAAGGGHVQENVQCVCRACNGKKGARPLGQLWLAGLADTRVSS